MAKNTAQIKHLQENYKQLRVNVKKEQFEIFKECCTKNGTTPSAIVKMAIENYIEKN